MKTVVFSLLLVVLLFVVPVASAQGTVPPPNPAALTNAQLLHSLRNGIAAIVLVFVFFGLALRARRE